MKIVERNPRPYDRFPNTHDRYLPSGGLPWYRETDQVRATQEEAWADAVAWARDYEAQDRFGNMAHAHGVIAVDGGWRGVVNHYHSNT